MSMESECPAETYFYLCQQFIHLNIQHPLLQKDLVSQLTNYVHNFPQDLGILYHMWIKSYPINKTDIFQIKLSGKEKDEMGRSTCPTKQIYFWSPAPL